MNGEIQLAIRVAAEKLGLRHMTFSSGAVHDAHSLAPHVPSGLIFVPSVGGLSHCPEEATNDDDLVAGANTLLQTILSLANRTSK
jgi:N-carbamoyl-L-amino-acid hydrolase